MGCFLTRMIGLKQPYGGRNSTVESLPSKQMVASANLVARSFRGIHSYTTQYLCSTSPGTKPMQVATKKKIQRPKNMVNSLNGQMSMWTTDVMGVRRAHIRCPHCD